MSMAISARVYQNYINGECRAASSGEEHANLNPARPAEIIGYFPRSTADDARAAIAAAVAAGDGWAGTSQLRRGEILLRAAELLAARVDEVATAMTREEGKTLREARGETLRGVAILRYYAGEGPQPIGEVYPSANTR